ncbi:MAG: helix-turn-helix domain-containing protein [Dehalococcoidia bacterium]|nr:helix-turn-helix domain-containing protein [Dehalococcoidia bacterium]
MDLRTRMITEWLSKEYSITELSGRYDVSRKTIYKWIERYGNEGIEGLVELARTPHHRPNATPEEIVKVMVEWT